MTNGQNSGPLLSPLLTFCIAFFEFISVGNYFSNVIKCVSI